MNTTARGTAFEIRVFELLKGIIDNDPTYFAFKASEIFLKRGYYSSKRDGEIVFDIAIECRRTDAVSTSLYVLIECKDYSGKIPVNDLEEFAKKAEQVTGLNVKCMFFSTSSLEQGALIFAMNSNIAVVRILPDDSLQWFVERTSPYLHASVQTGESSDVLNAMVTENFVSTQKNTFVLNGSDAYTSLPDYFKWLLAHQAE
ncbi:MAG: ImmA/IrrE family metallo-endopeptidase [Chitinophagaceae bacterium]|nr:ImmA/IrrE family metallo-endopeptidase [Chitinophagaceae bacterium]